MKDDLFLRKVGENIKRIRLEKGLTQVELGDMCNSEKSTIYRLESGKTNPTALTLKKIAESLEVSPGELLRVEERRKK